MQSKIRTKFWTDKIFRQYFIDMVIIDYYRNLSAKQKIQFRDHAMAITGWARSTFFYKMQHGNLQPLEITALEELIKTIAYDREN